MSACRLLGQGVSALALLGISYILLAAEPPPIEALTRAQAVEWALKANPKIRVAQREVEAAQARRRQADGFESPSLVWEFEEAKGTDPNGYGSQVLAVEQSIEWFGLRRVRKQAATLGVDVAKATGERIRLRVLAQVNKAFDGALKAELVRGLIAEMVRLTTEAVDISRVRFKSGTGSYVDLLRTRLARQRLRNELRDAEAEVLAARRQLGVLLGSDIGTTSVRGELVFNPLLLERSAYVVKAEQQAPGLVLIQRRADKAERSYRVVRKGRYPEFTLGLGRQRLNNGTSIDYAWAGQISLKLPIPGTDRQKGLEAEAYALYRAALDWQRNLKLRALTQLRQRFDVAKALAAQLENYRIAILPDAEDQLKAAQQEYRVRRIDALNLLDVYNTYFDTRRTYLNTLTRYRAALADLETMGEDLWEVEL